MSAFAEVKCCPIKNECAHHDETIRQHSSEKKTDDQNKAVKLYKLSDAFWRSSAAHCVSEDSLIAEAESSRLMAGDNPQSDRTLSYPLDKMLQGP